MEWCRVVLLYSLAYLATESLALSHSVRRVTIAGQGLSQPQQRPTWLQRAQKRKEKTPSPSTTNPLDYHYTTSPNPPTNQPSVLSAADGSSPTASPLLAGQTPRVRLARMPQLAIMVELVTTTPASGTPALKLQSAIPMCRRMRSPWRES